MMASICSSSNIVSVSCATKTLIVQTNGGELHSFEHSEVGGNNFSETSDGNQTQNKVHSDCEDIGIGLVCCDISNSGKLLAFSTLAKSLCIVNVEGSKPTMSKVFNLIRGASKIRFTPKSNNVLVADKSGDVYLFKPDSDDVTGQLILGHLSLLLDVLVTPDEKFIITCDRDEKIRISCYPNGYNIVAYCLGHSEFVSSLHLLPHNVEYLISTSGDGTMRVWDFKTGVEMSNCNTAQHLDSKTDPGESEGNAPAITDAKTTLVDSTTSLICVAVVNFSACLVYKCSSENNLLNCSFIQNISFETCHPWGLSLNSHVLWAIVSYNDVVLVQAKVLNLAQLKFEDNLSSDVSKAIQVLNHQKLTVDQKKNVVNLLYKRKFENVQEYLDRKELRLLAQEPSSKKIKA